ncbi:MAG: TetR family transcriptional regulator [Myxococcales bacterium]|nr:TetR family transcriptional regulator [Myxococcales bacterium]
MARWQPDARGRLERAALELYQTRGYHNTTVSEIAAHAGLTERTFFRYFADKREVLFYGSSALQQFLVEGVAAAPPSATPLDAALAALECAAEVIEQRRELAEQRRAVISATAELQERELSKLATLATAVAGALGVRGVDEHAATLAAEAAIAVFKVAFERWIDAGAQRSLAQHIRASAAELRAVVKTPARRERTR